MRLSFWRMKMTADATISVDQLTAKFKTWQLYAQLLEYIRQGKNRIRLVASCRWALRQYRVCQKNWTFEIKIICKLLYKFDSTECIELMIRKNTRSCTHGNYLTFLLICNEYKTFILRIINSKQSLLFYWKRGFQQLPYPTQQKTPQQCCNFRVFGCA